MGKFILNCIFALFLCYTWIYALQWIIGLFIAIYDLSQTYKRKMMVKWILTKQKALDNKVSVIIAAYNEENCVVETIQSLFEEDYPNLEIILVNDGSKDHMAEKVIDTFNLIHIPEKSKAKKELYYEAHFNDRTLIMITKANGGKSRALNCGLKYCESKYCLVLDADTRVEKGSIKAMVARFILDPKTIVCAGAVANDDKVYANLGFKEKCLLIYQTLEYYRTFYMQRILLDKINANVVVSGAFAMFDVELLQSIGGYNENTIGEDMELTLRLHAYCKSSKRDYKIAYSSDAKCITQFPFSYKDYFRQRRRWQIGMLQSLGNHKYMFMRRYYGIVGTFSSIFFMVYELAAPFIEVFGLVMMFLLIITNTISFSLVVTIAFFYFLMMLFMQTILTGAIKLYNIELVSNKKIIQLFIIGCVESFTFHLYNVYIKIVAILFRNKHKKTWQHITRA